MAERQMLQFLESMPYPSQPWLKGLFKSPIFLYRLGLGAVVGQLFMILTTTGCKTGRARRTAIEYHTVDGRAYVLAGWRRSDWLRNIAEDPRVTVQTAHGAHGAVARRVTGDEELTRAYTFFEHNPVMQALAQALGFRLTLEEFIAQKDQFYLYAFDPVGAPMHAPVETDLWPAWLFALGGLLAGWWLGRRSRTCA